MERPAFKSIGTPVEELDTPALVLDMAEVEHNLKTVHSFFQGRTAKLRPHVKTHGCPALAHLQLAAGGTVGGVCTAKVGQAEVFAASGIEDILIANQVVTKGKIERLCALARRTRMTVAVDDLGNVADLSEAAQAGGVSLNVLVDLNTRLDRCGVAPGEPAVALAKEVDLSPGLRFAGLMAYEGCLLHQEYKDLVEETHKVIRPVLETKEMLDQAGLEVGTVSVGGTHNYEISGEMGGVTEVQAGSYVLLDNSYRRFRPALRPALKVMATIVSHPEPGIAVADAGHKAVGADQELPQVEDIPGATVVRCSAEHGKIEMQGDAMGALDLGDKVWLTPYDGETCVNLYNFINVVRDGKLEAVWEVSGRGRYD